MYKADIHKIKNDEPSLCFDPSIFLKESFSTDDFLRSHRNKATLEVLRDDLGTYLKQLRLSMIELINEDYEDFVNLSKDLVGLNAGIEALRNPLENIKSEINVVRGSLQEAIMGMKKCIKTSEDVRMKKQTLFHLSRVIQSLKKLKALLTEVKTTSDNLAYLERIAAEFVKLQFSTSKCRDILSSLQKEDYEIIGKTLMELLQNTFLAGLCEQDSSQLERCLRMFASIGKVREAEDLVRKEVVAPFLYDVISETALRKEPGGLRGLFEKIEEFRERQLGVLLSIEGPEFDFLLNSLWVELVRRLELHTNVIFSAGDPEVFHTRYTDTRWFMQNLRNCCHSPASFDALPETVHLQRKWNLLVYYKIRFQEIAGQLEISFVDDTQPGQNSHLLKIPGIALMCLQRCWDRKIFIPELLHSFWRLNLQIIARYTTFLKDEAKPAVEDFTVNRMNNYVLLYSETARLAKDVKLLLSAMIEKHVPISFRPALLKSLEESINFLESGLTVLSDRIVEILVEKSAVPLSSVKDIPRLFRRTNRDMPIKPCDYVNQLLDPVFAFHESSRSSMDQTILTSWISTVLNQISRLYFERVCEVLENAQKTEESLRRLKKAKDKQANNIDSKGPSDDDKIRQQLLVDVQHFCERLKALEVENKIPRLKEMVQLVQDARFKSQK